MEIRIRLENDFLPEHTFDCGQCFRWNREDDGSYTGVAMGRAVNLKYESGDIVIAGASEADRALWEEYLDTKRSYSEIKKKISVIPAVEKAVAYGGGIRILKQEFFEMLISFIISQQSSIPKIKRSVEMLCRAYGEPICLSGKTYYSFPGPEALKNATEKDYEAFGVGYRAKYIERAVKGVLSGEIDADKISRMTTAQAKKALLSIYGVGNKVADCVLLFSLARFDSFPKDVWIGRVVEEDLGGRSGEELFGEYSGFAQQYLFYWKRALGR